MTIRQIVTYPDPRLHEPSAPIDSFDGKLHTLVNDMLETMYAAPGIGLAAVQVGVMEQVIVFDCSEDAKTPSHIINPKIVSKNGKVRSEEGCLSIPDYRDIIDRFETVSVEGFDMHGKEIKIEAEGLLSRCLQHEIDHINGILYVDHFSRIKKDMFLKWVRKQPWAVIE